MRPHHPPKVILRHCEDYDAAKIQQLVAEGIRELGLVPRGRVLIKPNVVCAGELFRYAYTRPEVVEGVIGALRDVAAEGAIQELGVGERCGITIPTRYVFREAGYLPMFRRTRVKRYHFEETPQVEVPLTHEKRLRDYLFTPEPVAKADFFVNCPKFKSHPWTTVTFSMKNYIGIQDDRHRLIDHDHALNRKVADLQHVIQPELVVIDAVIAGESRMLTPIPRRLNLLVMGNNQVAVDAVCCRIIGVDPREVEHIRLAYEDGFGPLEEDSISVTGDVPLGEARERAAGFRVGLVRVEKYFEGTHISAYAGPPPSQGGTDYCWGGCPGALEEAIEVLRLYDAECDEKLPRLHIVFGDYKGPLDIAYGEKVLFVGDCAEWQGELGGQLVQIRSKYQDRSGLDPHEAKHDDIYAKMLGVANVLRKARSQPFVRLEGCPVSVAELILVLAELGNVKNPYFNRREIVRFNSAYLAWRAATLGQRVAGQPYQIPGPADRGSAKPELSS